jgi:hypothetical protein
MMKNTFIAIASFVLLWSCSEQSAQEVPDPNYATQCFEQFLDPDFIVRDTLIAYSIRNDSLIIDFAGNQATNIYRSDILINSSYYVPENYHEIVNDKIVIQDSVFSNFTIGKDKATLHLDPAYSLFFRENGSFNSTLGNVSIHSNGLVRWRGPNTFNNLIKLDYLSVDSDCMGNKIFADSILSLMQK